MNVLELFAGSCSFSNAARGSATGTQGIKGNYERSKIPNDLCNDILKTHL